MTDLYQDLGIPRTASPEEVKKAHRRKVKESQPMPHGVTEALCWKAGLLIEKQNETILQLTDCLIAIDDAKQAAKNWRNQGENQWPKNQRLTHRKLSFVCSTSKSKA